MSTKQFKQNAWTTERNKSASLCRVHLSSSTLVNAYKNVHHCRRNRKQIYSGGYLDQSTSIRLIRPWIELES